MPGPASPPATAGDPVQVLAAGPQLTTSPGCVAWAAEKAGNVRLAVPKAGLRVYNRGPAGSDIAVALTRWADRPFPAAVGRQPRPVGDRQTAARSQPPALAAEIYGATVTVCSLAR